MLFLLLSMTACDGPSSPAEVARSMVPSTVTPPAAPADQPTVTLDRGNGALTWRALDHLADAELSFPEGTASPGTDGRFVLSGPWNDEGERRGGMHAYTTPLPFSTNMPRPNYAPMGARFVRDGADVPFNTTISAPTAGPVATWYVDHGRVVIISKDDPSAWATPAELVVDELAAAVKKRNFSGSGLTPVEFAQTTHMVERITRPALYLPAPASAAFKVNLPRKAKLKFGVGLLADPVTGAPSGDGVKLRLELDGKEIWSGKVDAAKGHEAVVVDIAGEAPRAGTLRWVSESGSTAVGDYLAVTTPTLVDAEAGPARRVLVVGIDTLRWDTLSGNGYHRATSPELDQWLAQSVQFDRAFTPAPRTKPSFLTAFTGRYPSKAKGAPRLAEVLNREGIATAGVVGNVHLVPRFGFARGMDHWEYENGARGDDQVERALAWLAGHQEEDSFLFVHFMDPHTFYNAPPDWADKFQDGKKRPKEVAAKFNRWQIINLDRKRDLSDAGKTWIRAAYDAEVAYTARQVSRLLAAVEQLPGQTLTIVHTDHGEEFWDHDGFEHNHSLYNELVHAELAIRPPGGWQGAPRVSHPVSLADIAPTVFDFLGVSPEKQPESDGMSLRPFVDKSRATALETLGAALVARPLPLGHMRYERDRWGVVFNGMKYILHTSSGREELYDLNADFGEQNNLFKAKDDTPVRPMRDPLGAATGWPVKRGWRIRVPTGVSTTVVTFDEPIYNAGILDPEWNAKVRANVEWGERPPVTPEEVGKVTVSDDKRVVTYEPGPKAATHTWWIQCEADPCPGGQLVMGTAKTNMSNPDRGSGQTRYSIERGWILVPADNVDAPEVAGSVHDDDMEALESLGYMQGDDHEK